MTLEGYLERYRLLRQALDRDERTRELLEKSAYAAFLRRFGGTESPVLAPHLLSRDVLEKRIRRRRRLCLRYAERLARAIDRIPSPVLRRHAQFRYLYEWTHEDIAHADFISLRSEYRRARRTEQAMTKAMRAVSPRARRCLPGRFTLSRKTRPLPAQGLAG